MFKKLIIITCLFLLLTSRVYSRERFFPVQSIDTMKFSRDIAREKLKDLSYDKEIETQVRNIAQTGATHVAVGTPYDEEFLPFLKRWVQMARKYKLKVWFRGNWSGWERWFDYPKFRERNIHIEKSKNFILENPNLFETGDIFTSCPECENGGPGDPRFTRDIDGHRNFLIEEYRATKQAFEQIGKQVASNYFSMNGDVANLIMDKKTVEELGGIITIDHYVKTTDKLALDAKNLISDRNGKVVLGEFGAPIPDIHGDMSEQEQARWVEDAFKKLIYMPEVTGVNYWTNKASSTRLWEADNKSRQVVEALANFYKPINISGVVKDELGEPMDGVEVKGKTRITMTKNGHYILPVLDGDLVKFSKEGYTTVSIKVRADGSKDIQSDIVLKKSHPSTFYSIFSKIINFLRGLFK